MIRLVFCLFCGLTLFSCVTHAPQYLDEDYDIQNVVPFNDSAIYTVYLIGDAGNAPRDTTTNVFKFLKTELECDSANSTIVWLGDNIYPDGLAPEGHPDHAFGKHRIMKQLEVHDNYKGKVFFIPGNHDWYKWGREGIWRQEELVEDYLSSRAIHDPEFQDNYFLPDSACGSIHVEDLTPDISLIMMDSHWFLNKVRFEIEVDHCENRKARGFLEDLRKAIYSRRDRSIIVAMHHPPHTYGSHGGKYKAKTYWFPLTQLHDALLLPLPINGIIVNRMRNYVSEQDNKNWRYRILRNELEEELDKVGSSLVAAGHEHNLQYIIWGNHNYIVSGAGSKNNPVGLGEGSMFSVGEKGYVKISFQDPVNAYMQFYVVNEEGTDAEMLYQRQIKFRENPI